METTLLTFKFLGTDDSVNECDCCGRKNLKATAALESLEDGVIVHFGLTCAARAVKWGVKETKAAINAADKGKAEAERVARELVREAEFKRWSAWLSANATAGHDVFTWIEALGGYTVARSRYNAS